MQDPAIQPSKRTCYRAITRRGPATRCARKIDRTLFSRFAARAGEEWRQASLHTFARSLPSGRSETCEDERLRAALQLYEST